MPVQYEFFLYPPKQPVTFRPGDEVFVNLRSERDTGHAVVLSEPKLVQNDPQNGASGAPEAPPGAPTGPIQKACEPEEASTTEQVDAVSSGCDSRERSGTCAEVTEVRRKPGKLRCRVQYICCGLQFPHTSIGRLTKRYRCEGKHRIIICARTLEYRALARSQVCWSEHVVELGSSFGHCTAILHQQAASVLGLEISEECIATSRQLFPHINFEQMDVLLYPKELVEKLKGIQVVFVDIGGDRHVPALVRCLMHVMNRAQPELIVVKSERLAALAKKQCGLPSSKKWCVANPAATAPASEECNNSTLYSTPTGPSRPNCSNSTQFSTAASSTASGRTEGKGKAVDSILVESTAVTSTAVESTAVDGTAAASAGMGKDSAALQPAQSRTQQIHKVLPELLKSCRCSRDAVRLCRSKGQTDMPQDGQMDRQVDGQTANGLHSSNGHMCSSAEGATPSNGAVRHSAATANGTSSGCWGIPAAQSECDVQAAGRCADVSAAEARSFGEASDLSLLAASRLLALWRHPTVQKAKSVTPEGLIPDGTSWWNSLEEQHSCVAGPQKGPSGASGPWPWFLKAKGKDFNVNILRLPWKETVEGVPICRLHNYGVCDKADLCRFDHLHCHHCGQTDHVARNCSIC